MKKLLIISILSIMGPLSVSAQNEVPEVSKAPHAAMQKLASWEGKWSSTMRYSADDGATWQVLAPEEHVFAFREKGLVMTDIPAPKEDGSFQAATYFSYDQYRQEYRIAVMDDTWGVMDIYEGNIEDNKLVLTNLKSGTTFPIGDGVWRGFKLMIDLDGEGDRMFIIHKTDDGGKSWQPNFEVTYSRE